MRNIIIDQQREEAKQEESDADGEEPRKDFFERKLFKSNMRKTFA